MANNTDASDIGLGDSSDNDFESWLAPMVDLADCNDDDAILAVEQARDSMIDSWYDFADMVQQKRATDPCKHSPQSDKFESDYKQSEKESESTKLTKREKRVC